MEETNKIVIEVPRGSYALDIAYALEDRLRVKERVLANMLLNPDEYRCSIERYQCEIDVYKSVIKQLHEKW